MIPAHWQRYNYIPTDVMMQITKLVVRTIVGFVVGILSGAFICGLEFALLVLIAGGNKSLGGIGIITNTIRFSALIGAIVGSFYGAIVGSVNGLAGFRPSRGTVSGLAIGAGIAAYVFFSTSENNPFSELLSILITGGILGFTISSLLMIVQKRITWLSG